ncbi:hypothetical protein EST38_g13848 [Candolleomyces aberdarensis]|uniref:Ankyrin n=1 Tax=Candolleomyces aberdarensis TaxID=2316362 RepID=A0A4Q2CYT2_9AGAR|nr:hypothetical protein EST38_g13848 [Candolleomyces aberdarensis]
MAAIGGHIDTAEAIMNKWPALSPTDRSADGKTPIMLAAGLGRESMLEFLLSRTPNDGLNARAACGCTALAYAVGQRKRATVRLLLSRPGVDANVANCGSGLTPLAWAAHKRDEAMLRRILLNPNLDVNARNPWTGHTALMQASDEFALDRPGARTTTVIELLMSHPDIDVNLGPYCGCTPLIVATQQVCSKIISKLISHPHITIHARCKGAGTALSVAADRMASDRKFSETHNSCSELISAQEKILRNGDKNDIHLCLQVASSLGLRDMTSELISKTRVRPKAVVLVEAAKAGYVSVVEMLLEHVDINTEDSTGCTALSAAVMKGQSGVVDLFLARQDILVNKGSIPPLLWAIERNQSDYEYGSSSIASSRLAIARQLLHRTDIDINVFDSMGRVPLTCAMVAERWDIVNLLLSRPDLDISLGEPPALAQACSKGQGALVLKLLARDDLDVNAVDAKGWSALSMAAHFGHKQIVELLLSRPDVKVNVGSPTPLMHACYQGHTGIVELLLTSRGSELDVNLRAESYKCRPTALWFACSSAWQLDIIRLLLQRSDIDVNIGLAIADAPGCNCRSNPLFHMRYGMDPHKLPTPLHAAAYRQSTAIPLLLAFDPRINVNALNVDGQTPFMLALQRPREKSCPPNSIMGSFLSHPAVLEEPFGSKALIFAAHGTDRVFFPKAIEEEEEERLNGIRTMLSRGRMMDFNLLDPNGRSVLSATAFRGSTKIAAFLLSLPSIDPNSGNPPPLVQASICSHHSVVRLLLEHPDIDLNQETDGYTALGGACIIQHHVYTTPSLDTIQLLLSHPKLDVNAGKPSPLSIAVRDGHIGAAKLLLEHPKINISSRMQWTVQIHEWIKCLRASQGPRPWSPTLGPEEYHPHIFIVGPKNSPIHRPSPSMSHRCLDQKAGRSRPYATYLAHDPLYQGPKAWIGESHDKNGAPTRSRTAKPEEGLGDPIFVYCTRFGPSEILKLLLPRGDLDVNAPGSCGCTALIWASSLGKWAIADTLLSRRATTVDARCPNHGHNALVAAAHRIKFDMVYQLLSHPRGHEMDPNVFAACGCNLLICASRSGDEDTIYNILPFTNWRDHPNTQDCKFSRTALQWASYFGHDSLIQLFLSHPSVSVDHRDKGGNTALMLAASGGHHTTVQILLTSPKVTNVHGDCNSNGDTALSLAEWHGHIDIARLLESAPLEQAAAVPPSTDTSDCATQSALFAPPFVSCYWISTFSALLSILFVSLIYFVLAFRVYG